MIVAYNSDHHISSCLDSLRASAPGWEVVVVDNGSVDGTAQRVAGGYPEVTLVEPGRNLGFAGGCNAGAARCGPVDYLLFLNPDVRVQPGALDRLVALVEMRGAAAAGPRMVSGDGRFQIGFAVRRFPTWWFLALDLCLVNRVWPRNPLAVRVKQSDLDYTVDQPVLQIAGACLLVRRDAYVAVGGFDERFTPLWFEDVDFCWSLNEAGRTVWYCSGAEVIHVGGHSISRLGAFHAKAYWYANMMRFAQKRFGAVRSRALRPLVVLGATLRGVIGASPSQLRVAWRALRSGDVATWYA